MARRPVSIRRPDDVPDGTPMAVSLRSTRELTTGTWRTFRPTYVTRSSPCNLDCPAGTDVRAFLTQAAANDAIGAWWTILEHNPLPGVCGRVCYHPCETNCNRASLDGRVAVHAVERSVADEAARLRAAEAIVNAMPRPSGRRVAVVGAGPAGISCAYHLARRGHGVMVFDEAREPGGMLRSGIPAYRLPRKVLDAEVGFLRDLRVEFQGSARLGSTLTWDQLKPFDAVFLGVGTQRSRPAQVPGDDLEGVSAALEFLRAANAGEHVLVAPNVLVIGGGNTAMDAARVALRLGAQVTVAYRRDRADMPAHPDEIGQAEAEGVRFVFNAMPIAFHGDKEGVARADLQRTRPGAPDASGRRRPEPIPGEIVTIDAEQVLMALGEELERDAFEGVIEVARGRLQADALGRTSRQGLFAGGDAATGAGTVVGAIGSGRRAADGIEAWLNGAAVQDEAPPAAVDVRALNLFYFASSERARQTLRPLESRRGFDEVMGGLSWSAAAGEAQRCFSCGYCTSCGNCVTFCPDSAASQTDDGFAIDLAHCKGCGLCVAECPRGAMELLPEEGR